MSDSVQSTMQDSQLTITEMLRHGATVYGESKVLTFDGDGVREATFTEVAERTARLAGASGRARRRTGRPRRHLPVEHAGAPRGLLRRARDGLGAAHAEPAAVPGPAGVRHRPRAGQGHHRRRDGAAAAGEGGGGSCRPSSTTCWSARATPAGSATCRCTRYEDLLAGAPAAYEWPELDERTAVLDVLHERHDRQPEGRRLQPPVDLPALAGARDRQRLRAVGQGPHPAGGADVPRERVGPGLRRLVRTAATSSCPAGSCRPSRWPR